MIFSRENKIKAICCFILVGKASSLSHTRTSSKTRPINSFGNPKTKSEYRENISLPESCTKTDINTSGTKVIKDVETKNNSYFTTISSRKCDVTSFDRKRFLRKSIVLSTFLTTTIWNGLLIGEANALEVEAPSAASKNTPSSDSNKETASVPFNIKCLLDLPPVAPNSVRVYLCRHGQTEFNRLKKVQGARIDQPLNETGEKMSFRIGQALAELPPEQRPSKILHSPLRRAKETAFGAVDTIMKSTAADKPLTLQLLPELGEIDFGKSEGTDATKAKVNMLNTFTSWSRGNIDYSYEGGESGRQILQRVSDSLYGLAQVASEKSNKGVVAAVSHSAFIRLLLATVSEKPLVQSATIGQTNGCFNVLDISLDKTKMIEIGSKSILFGGPLLSELADKDYKLLLPKVKVVRINEVRHLGGLI